MNFLHTYNPEPILFSLGPIHIYWYGFFIVLGIIAALLVSIRIGSFYQIEKDKILDLSFWLIFAGIIGARLYDVLLEFPYYLKNPLDIIKIWQGGLAIHGAIIGGIFAAILYCRKYKLEFWSMVAILAPGLALGQAIGRWGNYFNQELFGLPTSLPWGIPISFFNRPGEFISELYFHPTFLYESIGNFIIFALLAFAHYRIIKVKQANNNLLLRPVHAAVFAIYIILYSVLRFFLEYVRIDSTPVVLGLRWPQISSVLFASAALGIFFYLYKNFFNKTNK